MPWPFSERIIIEQLPDIARDEAMVEPIPESIRVIADVIGWARAMEIHDKIVEGK